MYCNLFLLLILLMTHSSITVSAQRKLLSADSVTVIAFTREAQKQPGYKVFSEEMKALIKKASPANTQGVLVKALLLKNKVMLEGIYNRMNVSFPGNGGNRRTQNVTAKTKDISHTEFNKLRPLGNAMVKIKTAPFDGVFRHHNYGNSPRTPDTSLSNSKIGKLVTVYAYPPPVIAYYLYTGQMMYGYKQSFTVPNNPTIVAARITCEYDWSFTGWDTYGSSHGIDLTIATTGINGPDINNLLARKYDNNQNSEPYYCQAVNLLPATVQTAEYEDYLIEQDNCSITFSGYVFPGSSIECKIGIGNVNASGQPFHTFGGVNGFYQYTYFKLKKITVTYLKAGE